MLTTPLPTVEQPKHGKPHAHHHKKAKEPSSTPTTTTSSPPPSPIPPSSTLLSADQTLKCELTSELDNTKLAKQHTRTDSIMPPPPPDTPLALALAANESVKITALQKTTKNLKRPHLKNLTRNIKLRGRKRKNRTSKREVKGKVIQGGHEQYALSLGMMLGIRCCIGRQNMSPTYLSGNSLSSMSEGSSRSAGTNRDSTKTSSAPLTFQDFMNVQNYVFPPSGSTVTPPHSLAHTFKFKAYCPAVFAAVRNLFKCDASSFMLSICGSYNFIEFISNAKSGQFFFYSHDGCYMIKTQTKSESKFLRRIMPHYYHYLSANPSSFMTRFYGMYRVKMYHLRRSVHFVIMGSVFNTYKRIDRVWDLKGSTVGRKAKPGESVLKDLDLVDEKVKLKVGGTARAVEVNKDKDSAQDVTSIAQPHRPVETRKEAIINQLKRDSSFLAKLGIMDYSLLLGIHDRNKKDDKPKDKAGNDNEAANASAKNDTVNATGFKSDTPLRRMRHEEEQKYAANSSNSVLGNGGGGGDRQNTDTGEDDISNLTTGNLRDHEMGGGGELGDGLDFGGSGSLKSKASPTELTPPEANPSLNKDQSSLLSASESFDDYSSDYDYTEDENESQCDDLDSILGSDVDESEDFDLEDKVQGLSIDPNTGHRMKRRSNDKKGKSMEEFISNNEGWRNPESPTSKMSSKSDRKSFSVAADHRSGNQKLSEGERIALSNIVGGVHTTRCPWTNRTDGGLEALELTQNGNTTLATKPGEIYFMGIIDILQQYNARKQAETFFKGFTASRRDISCVDPEWYAERFVKFIEAAIED